MDSARLVGVARSVRVCERTSPPEPGERRLRPVTAAAEDGSGVFLEPSAPAAWKTWAEVTLPAGTSPLRAALGTVRAAARRFTAFPAEDREVRGDLGSGAVALLRSQKLIVIDRPAGLVYHLLHGDHRSARGLLANEAAAAEALPEATIPLLFSHLEEEPYFLVQPYLRYSPAPSWRALLADMEAIVPTLFAYYVRSGLERRETAAYLDELSRRLEASLDGPAARSVPGLRPLFERIRSLAAERLAPGVATAPTVLAQVHGDFIAGHVLRSGGRRLLVDWSESHRYSVFHDLFYFHFQNHDTDLWDRFFELREEDLVGYYGGGWRVFRELLAGIGLAGVDVESFRLQLLICFLQELEHRLERLHPRYLPFWARQAARIA